jgi:HD superfamily phosphohydrolase
MVSSKDEGSGKLVVDPIHGDIHLTNRELEVIGTDSFQRLRHLKQLAMAQLVYPTATHTRFAHSVGALGTMKRILAAVGENLTEEQKENHRLAALLHDIGHYPYSHLMENVDRVKLIEEQVEGATIPAKKTPYPNHIEVGTLIVTSQPDLVKAIGGKERAEAVAAIFARTEAADPQLSKFIHSSFDIDRWDYLLRDSYAAGVPYGQIDINYLLNNLKISPQKVVGFKEKALAAVEHFLLSRFFIYRVVYYHKTIYGFEEACRQLLRRLRDRDGERYGVPADGEAIRNLVMSPELGTFTDAFVDNIIQKAINDEDQTIRVLASTIQNRRPPKLLKEVLVCEETEQKHHRGKTFMQNCRSRINDLAKKANIPLKQFLLYEITLPVVKKPRKHTIAEVAKLDQQEILELAHEEEEEDIKIFVGENPEPQSLMNIEHSIVVKYANYSLQIFRLYVVFEGEDKDNVIEQLKEKVKDWDKT